MEKNLGGPVIKPKQTESRLWIEKAWQEKRAPTMMTYNVKEEVVRANVPMGSFP